MSSDESDCDNVLPDLDRIKLWTKKDMTDWLAKRGLSKTARRKDILARRIYRHMSGEGSSSSSEEDEISEESKTSSRATKPEEKDWIDLTQPDAIPNIRDEDITNYYLHGKNPVTGGHKNLNRYLDKSRRFSEEPKYIDTIKISNTTSSDHTFFKTNVRPSMKKGLYVVYICLYKDTGMVSEAGCDCKVGATGYCSHVGGVLFRLVRLKNPCTSNLCAWSVPSVSRPLEPQVLSDINWWPGKANPAKPWPFVYKAGPCADSESFREEILDGLASVNPDCVMYIHNRQSHVDMTPFLDTYAAPCKIDDDVDLEEEWVQDLFNDYVDDIEVPAALSSLVERATRGQSCNPLWKAARTHVITSSNFGQILNKRPTTPPDNMLKQFCGYQTLPRTVQLSYGLKYESRARKLYMKQHQKKCGEGNKLVTVKSVGLVVSPKMPFLGASLDGLVECPKCGIGGIEIKCPWKFRSFLPSDIGKEKGSYSPCGEDGEMHLKRSHRYWHQVQGQMGVTELPWVDFVIFTRRGINVERISADKVAWEDNVPKLKDFYKKNMVAEFFTGRVKRNVKLY